MNLKLAFLTILVPLFCACSPVAFSESLGGGATLTEGTGVTGGGTTCDVQTLHRKTKILFVVDSSGSNAEGTFNVIGGRSTFTPATDPTKQFRRGAIANFLSDFSSKENFEWSFMTFSGSTALPYVSNVSDPSFTPNMSAMTLALNQFLLRPDSGATPYGAALEMAARAVAKDPDLNSSEQPLYFVIFLSDGFPTDDSTVTNRNVANLIGLAPGRVLLSTVFYGQVEIPDAISLLKSMASLGGGQFASVNTSSETNFKIDDVVGTSSCSSD